MSDEHDTDGAWERVASELRACREAQRQTWGDLDNATLGRYLAGDVSPQERRRVEAALDERPELRKLTDLVSDVLSDCEPASPPAVLPLRRTISVPKATTRRWRRWAAVAVAACLLFVLGYTVLPKPGSGPSAPSPGDLARGPDRDAGPRFQVAFHQPAPGPSVTMRDDAKRSVDVAKDGKEPEAAAQAEAEAVVPDPVVLACADGLAWAGQRLEKVGDLDKAEWSYNLAHKIQVWKLGPDAPPTVETRQKLGDVYQLALNTPAAPVAVYTKVASPSPMSTAYVGAAKDDGRTNSLNQLRERITRQAPAEVRKSVVPILMQNLRDAQTPQAREQLGRALAELGPAAHDAVPALEDCLARAQTPEERAAVRRVLAEVAAAGVHDRAELFSPLALKEGRRALRELPRDYNVQVYTLTEGASEDKGVAPNGVALVFRGSPVRVEVMVGRELVGHGFDSKQQERLRQTIEADLDRRDYDQGLLDGIRFIARFQAEEAKP